ncbi:MAG: sulfurtransferase [Halobacteriaceae archaeon]
MPDDTVVSADWLADRIDEVALIDVRDQWEYEEIGHLPGAVSVPFDRVRSDSDDDEGMLPGAERWTDLMETAGVSPDDPLVAYDDTHGVFAARFLVTALLYGHEPVHLLNGDYTAWATERPTSADPVDPAPATYAVETPDRSPLVDAAGVEAAIDGDAVLVDTRTPAEFADGHIPGAVNLDWLELVDDETRRLKPPAEIEHLLADHGITRDRRIVLYCNTARRISHTYLVLRWLEFPDVDFYEGSLTEWLAADRAVEQRDR